MKGWLLRSLFLLQISILSQILARRNGISWHVGAVHVGYPEESFPASLRDQMARILLHVVSRPLKGHRVTVVLEKDTPRSESLADVLTKHLKDPFLLLRLTKFHSESQRELLQIDDIAEDEYSIWQSVAVIVSTSQESKWWPLLNPPEEWSLTAAVLISASISCSRRALLELPLLRRTPKVALICPNDLQGSISSEIPFSVWTLKPFAQENQLVGLGPWKEEEFESWNQLFVDRFSDMSKMTISILGHPVDKPLFYYSQKGSLKGVNYESMKAIASAFNYSVEFSADHDLSWTDIFESVKRGNTSIFINFAPMTPERKQQYDATVPYYQEGYGLMLLVPPPLPRWQSILYPFSWHVWTAIVISVICTSITYHIIYYEREKSFITNSITVTQCLLSNPMAIIPSWWHVRTFLLLWWLVSMFIHMSYTSNLIAVLTVPVFPKMIQTAKELVESDQRLCMLDYGDFVPEALTVSTHPTLAALGRVLDMVPLNYDFEFDGEEYCMDHVLAGTHSHIDTYSLVKILYSLVGHGDKVYSLKEQLYPGYLVYLIQKNTPWSYKINTGVRRLVEAGLIKKWYDDAMEDFKGYLRQEKDSELQPLSLAHLQGSFFLFLVGIALSLLALAWEMCVIPVIFKRTL